jgi:site-specific DNA-cytosine methylase
MNGPSEKTFTEFFAGIGLMRIGLERAGWRITFANDIDEDKWQMYETTLAIQVSGGCKSLKHSIT